MACMQAEASLGANSAERNRRHSMSLDVFPDTPKDSADDEQEDKVDQPDNTVVELAIDAAQAFKSMDGIKLTRMAQLASKCAFLGPVAVEPRPRCPGRHGGPLYGPGKAMHMYGAALRLKLGCAGSAGGGGMPHATHRAPPVLGRWSRTIVFDTQGSKKIGTRDLQ